MADRQERTSRSSSANEDTFSTSNLTIFGYASKLYRDPILAHKLATGYLMVPWQSHSMDNPLLLDRYDVRHLIMDDLSSTDNQSYLAASRKRQHNLIDEEDSTEYDLDRYADLDVEEEKLLFDMDDAEDRNSCIEEHKQRRKRQRSIESRKDKPIQYHYDYNTADAVKLTIAERPKDIQKMAQRYHIPLSSAIILPSSDQDQTNPAQDIDLIDRTAQTILQHAATQPLNVCEIQFQVRHCQDPRYDFLGKQHVYYPFYRHVLDYHRQQPPSASVPRTAFTTNATNSKISRLVDYGSSDDDDDCQAAEQKVLLPSSDILPVILKTANSVAKVGLDLEQKVKRLRRDDPTFGFLQPQHAYHPYYRRKLAEFSSS